MIVPRRAAWLVAIIAAGCTTASRPAATSPTPKPAPPLISVREPPPPSPVVVEALRQQVLACWMLATRDLDDRTSDASTVARAVCLQCRSENEAYGTASTDTSALSPQEIRDAIADNCARAAVSVVLRSRASRRNR